MAQIQEPEVQFAQRLASNERPIRSKAVKKLRKYIQVRSQKDSGGFSGDELLKLWKGLFYCLWMQDKPLLQEDLSKTISSLIHSFHTVDSQFLFLETCLQTLMREWNGIDRLRMDKFFQMVRFVFRQTFELLKRKNWDSSVVARFLELFAAQVLQSDGGVPSGLQFHILDLYMTELAAVGADELTADQNLTFIEPFCTTAAKTKNHILFSAICSSIFNTVIDQAPFAIDDLMKELKAAEDSDSDSGQASAEEEDDNQKDKTIQQGGEKASEKKLNGQKSNEVFDDDLNLSDSDAELPGNGDMGPFLQFDYGALADKLFQVASRSHTSNRSRRTLYKIVRVLRGIREGIFPRNDYPEEVSTDEDDDMFGSRRRMKKGKRPSKDEEGVPAAKKKKKKKEKMKSASELSAQHKDSANGDGVAAKPTAEKGKKKKKRKSRKNRGQRGVETAAEESKREGDAHSVTARDAGEVESDAPTSASSSTVTEETAPPSVTVGDGGGAPVGEADVPALETKRRKKGGKPETKKAEVGAGSDAKVRRANEASAEAAFPKKSRLVLGTSAASDDKTPAKTTNAKVEAEVISISDGSSQGEPAAVVDATPSGRKKSQKRRPKADRKTEGIEAEAQVNGANLEARSRFEDGATSRLEETPTTQAKRKCKRKKARGDAHVEAGCTEVSKAAPVKMKKKKKKKVGLDQKVEAGEAVPGAAPLTKRTPKEAATALRPQAEGAGVTMTTPMKRQKQRLKTAAARVDEVREQVHSGLLRVAEEDDDAPELASAFEKKAKKKKRKIPVVFEFEADELEAAAASRLMEASVPKKAKVANLQGAEGPPTPLRAVKSSGSASGFLSFQNKATIPTPLFFRSKGSPGTPSPVTKKKKTPKSESKKVTFGLKSNKTAEFKKSDRSLLVSPDGSSRVPFDPQQKPKFGVLKSPPMPLSTNVKKTPNTKKKIANTPRSTTKRRPTAADFF